MLTLKDNLYLGTAEYTQKRDKPGAGIWNLSAHSPALDLTSLKLMIRPSLVPRPPPFFVVCCLLCDNTQVSSYQNNTCKVTGRGALEASFPGSPRVLQATESWVGPGNEASVLVCTQVAFLSNKYWLTDLAFCTSTIFLRQEWSLGTKDYPHYSYRPANLAFTRFKSA